MSTVLRTALDTWEINKRPNGGVQIKIKYPNGYSASIINDGYGARWGYLEIAVIYDDDIVYDTPITGDVVVVTSIEEAERLCRAIAALPPRD